MMNSSENFWTSPCELFDSTLLVDEARNRSGQMDLESRGVTGKRRADRGDQRNCVAARAEGREIGDDLRLLGVLVGREPEILDAKHAGNAFDACLDRGDLLDVRSGEHGVLAGGDQRRDAVLRVLERLREILGLH